MTNIGAARSDWRTPAVHPIVAASATHVWRVRLDRCESLDAHLSILSEDERERVRRFYFPHHGKRYAIAHSALRQILAAYEDCDPRALQFITGEHGKPSFARSGVVNPDTLHFNLSHSGDLALVAVARHGAVGVDVERWRDNVQHLEISDRFFSPYEQQALRAVAIGAGVLNADAIMQRSISTSPNATVLHVAEASGGAESADQHPAVLRGFFSTWSRKEAYLKATGHGIAHGLHHFDVTLEVAHDEMPESHSRPPVLPARLIADRLDPQATERWFMKHIDVGPGYSGALVSTRPEAGVEGAVALFESPYI